MSRGLDSLHPRLREQATQLQRDVLEKLDAEIGFPQCLRSFVEQAEIHAQGRTTPGPPCLHRSEPHLRPVGTCPKHPLGSTVTNAGPGYSWHNWGLAFDIKIITFPGDTTPKDVYDGPWDKIGALGEALGLEWGGRWKRPDRPHFENRMGKTIAGLLAEFPQGLA